MQSPVTSTSQGRLQSCTPRRFLGLGDCFDSTGLNAPLLWKALAYRVIAMAFTALFTGWSKSVEIHVGLTLIYYLFDLLWERRMSQPARAQRRLDPPSGSDGP